MSLSLSLSLSAGLSASFKFISKHDHQQNQNDEQLALSDEGVEGTNHKRLKMCTATYIPNKKNNFILTSNRDDAPARAAKEIGILKAGGRSIYFPKDAGAGGTWMAMDSDGRAVCLLNGADEKQKSGGTYRRSRGLMILDYFSYEDHVKFISDYDFNGIEPFTMILAKHQDLTVLKWDGTKKHVSVLDPHKMYMWHSVILYDKKSRDRRNAWFESWKQEENYSHESIVKFHKTAGVGGDEESMIIDRPGVKTLSVTSIQKKESSSTLEHYDLEGKKIRRVSVEQLEQLT